MYDQERVNCVYFYILYKSKEGYPGGGGRGPDVVIWSV